MPCPLIRRSDQQQDVCATSSGGDSRRSAGGREHVACLVGRQAGRGPRSPRRLLRHRGVHVARADRVHGHAACGRPRPRPTGPGRARRAWWPCRRLIERLAVLGATEATTTTRPQPGRVIDGSARRMQRKGAVRLRSSSRCQSRRWCRRLSRQPPRRRGDQDLDRTPVPPRSAVNGASSCSGSVTSAGTTSEGPASMAAPTRSSAVRSRPRRATRWPCADRRRAVAAPIPCWRR